MNKINFSLVTVFIVMGFIFSLSTFSLSTTAYGNEYDSVDTYRYFDGKAKEYWLFEPIGYKGEGNEPETGVVIFIHGFLGVSPHYMGGWIDHIAKQGYVVVFPVYQKLLTPLRRFAKNAFAAVEEAYDQFPELNNKDVYIVGFSAGGNIAANFGVDMTLHGLPNPEGVMCIFPGSSWIFRNPGKVLPNLANMPESIKLRVAVGEADHLCHDFDGLKIFDETVKVTDKAYFIIETDREEGVVANHLMPSCILNDYKHKKRRNYKHKKRGNGFIKTITSKGYSPNSLQRELWDIFDDLLQ